MYLHVLCLSWTHVHLRPYCSCGSTWSHFHTCTLKPYDIWSAFQKLRKATIRFVMSVCLSGCPHGTNRLPLDEFSWNLTFADLSYSPSRKCKVYWILTVITVLYTKTKIHFTSYLAQFFLQWAMFHTKAVEKIKSHILCSVTFFWKSCRLWDSVGNLIESDRLQMTQ